MGSQQLPNLWDTGQGSPVRCRVSEIRPPSQHRLSSEKAPIPVSIGDALPCPGAQDHSSPGKAA
eukprot:364081-Chlamydomonas_euryale.AAC.8